jgi:uncharacterized repeat protein (TIGR03803 family)
MFDHTLRLSLIALFGSLGFVIPSGAAPHDRFHWRTLRPFSASQPPFSVRGERVLYAFQSGNDGEGPSAGLIADENGALYGMTTYGGGAPACVNFGCGTAFKLTPTGSGYAESVLFRFQGGNDGAEPVTSMTADTTGALYGTTRWGGRKCTFSPSVTGCGTVFKLMPVGSHYSEKVLYRFKGGRRAALPVGRLIADASGALYGTTFAGGDRAPCSGPSTYGCGTVFKLTRIGSRYEESVPYDFKGERDGADPSAGLIVDGNGVLYGTTSAGGGSNVCGGGCGIVFKLAPAGRGHAESVIYRFRGGGGDGADPTGSLIADGSGALYGTTVLGGSGYGTVFKLTPQGSGYAESVLYSFHGGDDGVAPVGALIAHTGALYGATAAGGGASACVEGCGIVFKLSPARSGYSERVVYRFQGGNDGASPNGSLIADRRGALYGTTFAGGGTACGGPGCGTVFKIVP